MAEAGYGGFYEPSRAQVWGEGFYEGWMLATNGKWGIPEPDEYVNPYDEKRKIK